MHTHEQLLVDTQWLARALDYHATRFRATQAQIQEIFGKVCHIGDADVVAITGAKVHEIETILDRKRARHAKWFVSPSVSITAATENALQDAVVLHFEDGPCRLVTTEFALVHSGLDGRV